MNEENNRKFNISNNNNNNNNDNNKSVPLLISVLDHLVFGH